MSDSIHPDRDPVPDNDRAKDHVDGCEGLLLLKPALWQKLRLHLQDPSFRDPFLRSCRQMLAQEVFKIPGLQGKIIKIAYRALEVVQDDLINLILDALIDDFAQVLASQIKDSLQGQVSSGLEDPKLHVATNGSTSSAALVAASSTPITRDLEEHNSRCAKALLRVTDQRIVKSDNMILLKTYKRLRCKAESIINQSMPNIMVWLTPWLHEVSSRSLPVGIDVSLLPALTDDVDIDVDVDVYHSNLTSTSAPILVAASESAQASAAGSLSPQRISAMASSPSKTQDPSSLG